MVKHIFENVKITGLSACVPHNELSLLDMPNLYDGNQKKIKRVIESSGFLKRRITDPETTTADLCEFAARDLINGLNIDKNTIDGLLFISYTPDYLMPATSYILHKKFDLSEDCICMDIPQACSGFEIGLYQASMMINSGCKRVLLLVGDTFSKFTDMFNNNSAPVFGDAGSACLIDYDAYSEKSYFEINSEGKLYEALICRNGGFRNPAKKQDFYEDGNYIYDSSMQGAEIFNFTIDKISPQINDLLKFANIDKDNISHFVLHQANKFILENIAIQLGLENNAISAETLTNYGNQCGASIPCTICNTLRNEVSTSNNKMLLSGFGVGLSWASAIVDMNKIYCSKLLEYEG